MTPPNSLRPFLRCGIITFVEHLGSALSPIVSPTPQPFDGGKYGTLYTYTIDGSRLSADQALSLAKWISLDTGGPIGKLLEDIQDGECRISDDGRFELVWLDEGAKFWG
jgi:hypothetical protein